MFPENLTPGENKEKATLTPLNAIDTHSRPFNFANPTEKPNDFCLDNKIEVRALAK